MSRMSSIDLQLSSVNAITLELSNADSALSINQADAVQLQFAEILRGPQGVPGETGPAGAAGAQFIQLTADIALGGHRAVIATATGCNYADNTNASHANHVMGITNGAVSAGATAQIIAMAELTGFSGLTPGWPLFLSTNGVLTQAIPGTGFIQQLGIASSATTVLINLQPAIQLT